MNEKHIKKFEDLCWRTKIAWDHNISGTKELEPYLLEILNFVKSNIEYRDYFSQKFNDLLISYEFGPLEIVIFCMRELKWDEVRCSALKRQAEEKDPRIKIAIQDVLNVYSLNWEDADLYDYYSKETKD